MKKNPVFVVLLLILSLSIMIHQVCASQEANANVNKAPIPIIVSIGGLKWMGEASHLIATVTVGNATSSSEELFINTAQEVNVEVSLEAAIPSPLSVELKDEKGTVLRVDGEISPIDVRVNSISYRERAFEIVSVDAPLMTVTIVSRSYSINIKVPVKIPDLRVRAEVDGYEVAADVKDTSEGVVISLVDVIFTKPTSTFSVKVLKNNSVVVSIDGSTTPDGVANTSLSGLLHQLEVSMSVVAGPKKAVVPAKVLKGFSLTSMGSVTKTTNIIVRTETAVQGTVPVVLKALSVDGKEIGDAMFEIILPSGISILAKQKEIVYLIEGQNVTAVARAQGYKEESKTIYVTKDISEVTFTLRPSGPPPWWMSLLENITSIITSRYFIGIALSLIIVLLIIAVMRR